jgi:hypothetical protein
MKSYLNNAFVYSFNFQYEGNNNGGISKPVKIDSLDINEFNIHFDFNIFEIEVKDIPMDQSDNVYAIFKNGLGGAGIWGGNGPGKAVRASAVIEGTAVKDITKIDVFSLNNAVIFATDKNRELFYDLEEKYGDIYYTSQKDTDFAPGDKIELEKQFIFADFLNNNYFNCDAASINYGISITDGENNTYTRYECVSIIPDPAYLLVEILHEELEKQSKGTK